MLKPAGKFAARALERWLSGEYRSLEMIKPTPGTPDPAPETPSPSAPDNTPSVDFDDWEPTLF